MNETQTPNNLEQTQALQHRINQVMVVIHLLQAKQATLVQELEQSFSTCNQEEKDLILNQNS